MKNNTNDTDIKKLIESYNEMLDRFETLFKREEQFTSDVSHELRTPLTVLLSECEYAISVDDTNEKNTSMAIMHKQLVKMINLVNELLAYSRLAKNESIELENINISEVTEEIKINNTKNIDFKLEIEASIYLKVNEGLYIRMVQNLVDNAVKYNKENGFIILKLYKEGNNVYLIVKDSGIGIDNKSIDHIFDRFYRIDSSRHNKESLGLGLSFVKEIVRLHKATIDVDSKINEGTTFKITFKENE